MIESMPAKPMLGKLVEVDIRSYWQHEAQEFTPWLAKEENLELLEEAIGQELEFESSEQAVGPFAADIVCRRVLDGQTVLIENQLEKTDHAHLGQIITYAAGLHATTIVWIARRFTDEHRAALEWLNEHTPTEVAFFGLGLELWRIGNSPPAPRFNVIVQPNAWTKPPARPTTVTQGKPFRLEYWEAFAETLKEDPGSLHVPAPCNENWVSFAVGVSEFHIGATISPSKQRIRTELYIGGLRAKTRFDRLLDHRSEIDAMVPGLDWLRLDGRQDCRIALHSTADPQNREDWPNQHKWFRDTVKRFDVVFRPLVKKVSL